MSDRSRWIKKLDSLFSEQIKSRDSHTCQRCGGVYPAKSRGIHNSHFWKRGLMGTRWDEKNCAALCYGCHRRWEGDKQGEYRDFMVARLGQEEYDRLEIRARSVTKFSAVDLKLMATVMQRGNNAG